METLLKDIRYGARRLWKNPGFTIIAVLTLTLGIGANAAIFSVVNGVLLRPLPFKDPDRLMAIRETKLPEFPEFSVSPGNFLSWRSQNTSFERMAAIQDMAFNMVSGGLPERIRGAMVTDGFFPMLGVQPGLGRDFLAEEDQPGHNQVVIVSYGFWQRRFGGDAGILKQSLNLNGRSYAVIGVLPASFKFGDNATELWSPMGFTAQDAEQHGGHYIGTIGRLKPGVSREQAQADLSRIAEHLAIQYPGSNAGWNAKVMTMIEATVKDIRSVLWVLLGAVGFVLLIACANVANLLLAKAAGRQKEIAIRSTLGAGRWRIVRQMLTESLLLSFSGGLLGLLLAIWGTSLLLQLAPEDLPRANEVTLDSPVLIFTVIIALLTGLIFGLAPALQASKPNLNETIKDAGRGSTDGGRRQLIRSMLVVLEVSLALVLLVGAGLMIKSFLRMHKVSPGFDPTHALTASLVLPERKYPEDDQRAAFFKQLAENVAAIPGVQSAGVSQVLPMTGDDYILGFSIEGRPPYALGQEPHTTYYAVSPDYFKAMGIPLLKGRYFTDGDRKGTMRVAIINEAMARKMFPNEDPLGKRINVTNGPVTYREIVGIVGDVKQYSLTQENTLQTYEPHTQQPFGFMSLVVRAKIDPATLAESIRREVLQIDKEQPVDRVKTLAEYVTDSMSQQRFSMTLLGIFAGVAIALAVMGIYGVMSYSVTQRNQEIGIRIALGARSRDVFKLVLGQGMILALIGIAIGLAAAFAVTRVLSLMLYSVSATDPSTFALISALLLLVALIACYLPARRATRIDPLVAMRSE